MEELQYAPLPRYYRLREIVRQNIADGMWKPGDVVPSERLLSEQYGVSRMTARQAISQLVQEGLLYREQGKGTFVAKPRITQQLTRLTGFTEDMRARGSEPRARVLGAEMVPAEAVADHLRVSANQPIYRLKRLRFADGEPLAIETSHIYFIGCERLMDEDLEHSSLYDLLRRKYRVAPVEAHQEMEASLILDDEALWLEVERGTPVLRTKRITYAELGRPVEYAEAVYLGPKYRFYAHLLYSSSD